MEKMKIIKKIKKVTLKQILGIFIFILMIIPALIFKIYLKISRKRIWLVCETETTARDNGYIFFKYLKENHKEIKAYYAISKNCYDYEKLKQYNKDIIKWGSIKHYFIYMSDEWNISSHKEGNPNHAIFTIMHLVFNLYNNSVFLQHGVLYQNFEMFHKQNSKFKIFICGAKPEYEFVLKKFGYSKKEIKYTGLARFDNLQKFKVNNNEIIYIPTWRRWLDTEEKFKKSEYLKKINSFLNNEKLHKLLVNKNMTLLFYVHESFEKYKENYKNKCDNIKILGFNNSDIQDKLKSSGLMITDFSSVATDFAYMKKPIIYYQFDKNDYLTKHIGKDDTYFDFKRDGFGDVVNSEEEIINNIEKIYNNNFNVEEKYIKRIDNFFELHDNKNCERIFNEIIKYNE